MVGPASRNLWGDGRVAYTHSGAASQLAVGFGWSVPLRGTCGVWGLLDPQLRCFAACSGFQIVGPASRNLWGDGRFAYTHSCAASQLAVGFR